MSVTLESTKIREKFVQDLNGTTMGEVLLYTTQFPLLAFVATSLELLILNKLHKNTFKYGPKGIRNFLFVFFLETLMIILPVTLMFTIFSDYILVLFFLISGITLIIVTSGVSYVDEQIMYWKLTNLNKIFQIDSSVSRPKKQLFLTYFRSFVLLVTAVSILGVDFHIFPRRFAKTENYGVSLMDLGVGLFIVSSALVEKGNLSVQGLKNTLSSSFFLLLLGILRSVLIKNVDYAVHITEYGRHWNFFFTLAFVKLLSSALLILFSGNSFLIGLILSLIHQYLLSYSLESLVLSNAERVDWFSDNREGIISLCGYLSIHLFGITISNVLHPVGSDKNISTKNKFKAIVVFTVISMFLFSALFYFDSEGFKVSRRLANLFYILWVIAISLVLIVMFLLVEFMTFCILPLDPRVTSNSHCFLMPIVLEGINFNGLIFFLMSNLLTGLINIYIDAFNTGPLMSSVILLFYMLVDCAVVFFLYVFNVRLKF